VLPVSAPLSPILVAAASATFSLNSQLMADKGLYPSVHGGEGLAKYLLSKQ
jgi:hypothetical protein